MGRQRKKKLDPEQVRRRCQIRHKAFRDFEELRDELTPLLRSVLGKQGEFFRFSIGHNIMDRDDRELLVEGFSFYVQVFGRDGKCLNETYFYCSVTAEDAFGYISDLMQSQLALL